MPKTYYVYILMNKSNTTTYIGVTNNLERRVLEHKTGRKKSFSKKYKLKKLVYFEELPTIEDAIKREKQLKNWHRDWKFNLIRQTNPQYEDLAKEWYEEEKTVSTDAEMNSA